MFYLFQSDRLESLAEMCARSGRVYNSTTFVRCPMGRHSFETPCRKRKDLYATKLDWLDVATKVIVLVTVIVKLVTAMLHVGL